VAELGIVRDLAQAGAGVAELAQGAKDRLGQFVAANVVLGLGEGTARALASTGASVIIAASTASIRA